MEPKVEEQKELQDEERTADMQEEIGPVDDVGERTQSAAPTHSPMRVVEVGIADLKVEEPRAISPTVAREDQLALPVPEDPEDMPPPLASVAREDTAISPAEVKMEDSPPLPAVASSAEPPAPVVNADEESSRTSIGVEDAPERPVRTPTPMETEEPLVPSETLAEPEKEVGSTITPTVVNKAAREPDDDTLSKPRRSQTMNEEDPHEWLLEHYADGSPPRGSRGPSPAAEEPPQTPSEASPPPGPPHDVPKPASPPPRSQPEPKKRGKKKVPSPSRSPTPTALLEQELDGIVPDDLPISAPSPRSDADTDFGLELDLAAGSTPDAGTDPDSSMGNDLDDELLSLVDDKPRHSHSHSHSHHTSTTKAPRPTPHVSHVERRPPPEDPVVKKQATPTVPPVRAPSSAPTPPSERVVMPPPIAPPQVAKQATPQVSEKVEKPADESGASAGTKKKEPTGKVCFYLLVASYNVYRHCER